MTERLGGRCSRANSRITIRNDPADEATNLFDRERDSAATDNMNRILAKIDRALAKIEEGTYGLSEIDGTPIPVARLEALPYALTTVDQEDRF